MIVAQAGIQLLLALSHLPLHILKPFCPRLSCPPPRTSPPGITSASPCLHSLSLLLSPCYLQVTAADSDPLPPPGPTCPSTGLFSPVLTCPGQSHKASASLVSVLSMSLSSIFLASDMSPSPGSQTPQSLFPFYHPFRPPLRVPSITATAPSQIPCLQAHPLGSVPTRRCLRRCHPP